MEFVDVKALKTSLWPEMTLKSSNPQVICEDFWLGNGGNAISGDDLFVEGLLDFSNEDVHVGFVEDEEEEEEDKDSLSGSSSQGDHNPSHVHSGFSLKEEPLSVQESVLAVPADDLADLEWLSHFVEDSFSEFSLQHVTKTPPEKNPQISQNPNRAEPVSLKRPIEFVTSIPAKSKRSKRSRTTIGRVWSVGSLPMTTATPPPITTATTTELSSCSSSSPTSSSSTSCVTGSQPPLDFVRAAGKPPGKKQKRKLGAEPPQRRCSHCGVVKTPQWRTGPNGAKTLCNACGVRFKSGRLLPEYRPACSPTFSSAVHSNNHRKVLEMRRKKEIGLLEPGPGPVQIF